MSSTFDVARNLSGALGDRVAAWQFIRDFAAAWLTPLMDDDGCNDAELDAAQTRLGVRLPVALGEAYRLLGRRPDLTSNHNSLLGPERIHVDAGGNVLVFLMENQALTCWGVRLVDLDQPDPPVVLWASSTDDPRDEYWHSWLDRVSTTFVTMVLLESLFSSKKLVDCRVQEPGDADLLEQRFARLALPELPLWLQPAEGPGVRWFAGPDVIVRDEQRTWLWARARTPVALRALRQALPGQWEEGEG